MYALAVKFLSKDELMIVKERIGMTVLGQMLLEEGIERGIRAFVQDNLEEGIPEERILEKLSRRFSLSSKEAKGYYDRFSAEEDA